MVAAPPIFPFFFFFFLSSHSPTLYPFSPSFRPSTDPPVSFLVAVLSSRSSPPALPFSPRPLLSFPPLCPSCSSALPFTHPVPYPPSFLFVLPLLPFPFPLVTCSPAFLYVFPSSSLLASHTHRFPPLHSFFPSFPPHSSFNTSLPSSAALSFLNPPFTLFHILPLHQFPPATHLP